MVEPAFGHDVNAREAYSGHEAHRAPGHWVYETALDENRHRGDGRQGCEYANVPDLPQQRRGDHGAEHISHVVAGHDGTGHRRRESLQRRTQPEQRALQAGTQHEHTHAEKQRPGCGNDFKRHEVSGQVLVCSLHFSASCHGSE